MSRQARQGCKVSILTTAAAGIDSVAWQCCCHKVQSRTQRNSSGGVAELIELSTSTTGVFCVYAVFVSREPPQEATRAAVEMRASASFSGGDSGRGLGL